MEGFHQFNAAVAGAKRIEVYDPHGNRVAMSDLGTFRKVRGKKLYSIGIISDPHVGKEDAAISCSPAHALRVAGVRFNRARVDAVCIAGDLVENGLNEKHWDEFHGAVSVFQAPVYKLAGNHETAVMAGAYLDFAPYYTVQMGDDVFFFLSHYCGSAAEEHEEQLGEILERLTYDLEQHRDKRCFVFQHNFPVSDEEEKMVKWGTLPIAYSRTPLSLLQHYKNTIVFHGHAHNSFDRETASIPNYSEALYGCRSVHIPPLCDSGEGYIADIYPEGVHLRGMNLLTGTEIPRGTFWADTTLKTVPAGTFNKEG